MRAFDWKWSVLSLTAVTALLASVSRIASDWGWVVALGDHIRRTGTVPDHVPFASAPSDGWHNVPVLGEVVASWTAQGGPGLVVLAHLTLVVLSLLILLAGARRLGGEDRRAALLLGVLVLGALPSWSLVRLQSYSLPLFAAMVVLVVTQSRRSSRWIWSAPLLVLVWGNLHGGVLLGVCVLGAYLAFDRLRQRPAETVAVGVASLAAVLCTPQGLDTVGYYVGVLDNAAADRGEGLWGRLDPGDLFDVLMTLALVVLGVAALRHRRPAWEYVGVLGLGIATAGAARNGVWLLCLLFLLATASLHPVRHEPRRAGSRAGVLVAAALAVAVAAPVVVVRGDTLAGSDARVVAAVVKEADGRVVLAPAPLVESLAVAGARIWAGNPLDAFDIRDQEAYLDFLAGRPGMIRAVEGSELVVTRDGTAAGRAMEQMTDFRPTSCSPGWTCYTAR